MIKLRITFSYEKVPWKCLWNWHQVSFLGCKMRCSVSILVSYVDVGSKDCQQLQTIKSPWQNWQVDRSSIVLISGVLVSGLWILISTAIIMTVIPWVNCKGETTLRINPTMYYEFKAQVLYWQFTKQSKTLSRDNITSEMYKNQFPLTI